jgi:hypothetical protein
MKFNRTKQVKETAKFLSEMIGVEIKDFDAEDIETLAMDCQCNYEGICEILGLELPESLKPVMVD